VLRKRPPRARLTPAQAADPAAALAAAVSALAQRDYCSGELAQRLAAQGFATEVVQAALTDLRARGYLDDARYARQYVSYHAERGQGPLRIGSELQRLGLSAELVDTALDQYAEAQGGWARLACEVRIRRFGLTEPRAWAQKAKQARFLQYRGFSTDHIRCALGPGLEPWSEVE
jgi:regulatory protein